MSDKRQHWDSAYAAGTEALSWTQGTPELSLRLIARSGCAQDAPIIDVGGGASPLALCLLERGYRDLTVLDLSEAALALSRDAVTARGFSARWISADITRWTPDRRYAVWHDRAVFHFLTEAGDRARYVAALRRALGARGHAVFGTFAPDGPERCSGLPVRRYDGGSLLGELGAGFRIVEEAREQHLTPAGRSQSFAWTLLSWQDPAQADTGTEDA